MQVDDPPYLPVGTAVSAKYKGAFCEAKVSKVDRVVKCKVTFKGIGLGSTTVSDNDIKGTLRVGQQVLVKHSDQNQKDFVEATITKIQDSSQYTVVFDDGDITTLRRTALCLKSGRHFNESETLDQLPLTHPEHFGIPVMGGKRGRRNRLLKDESSDEDMEEENEPDLEGYTQDIGRVVSVETGESKRGKERWFPGLIVIPSAQPTVKINIKDEFLIRSFRDDRYYTVPKKEVSEFNRDVSEKIESTGLAEAIQKAIKFLDSNELPLHWEKNSLFNVAADSNSDDNASETTDEEQSEEKDRFVAELYKHMDDSGTPLNKTPTIATKDIDLHRLFRVVHKLGGYNRVTNQNKWKSVSGKIKLPVVNQIISNQVKSVYKKCLLSYEGFFRTLGVTMTNPTRTMKKDKGRSLIRDKDRTPISSPRPDIEDGYSSEKSQKSVERKGTPVQLPENNKPETSKIKRKSDNLKENKDVVVNKKIIKIEPIMMKDAAANSDASDTASSSGGGGGNRPSLKKTEIKIVKEKEKKIKSEKIKIEKSDEPTTVTTTTTKKEDKIQFTRSKSQTSIKSSASSINKEMMMPSTSKQAAAAANKETLLNTPKTVTAAAAAAGNKPSSTNKKTPGNNKDEEPIHTEKEKKIKQKKNKPESSALNEPLQTANLGDKLIVYYGPTNESKVTYEAKVVDIDKDHTGPIYLVHYTGWNTRYDEWIPASRIAENLTTGVKSKRSKGIPPPVNVKPAKRSRLTSSSVSSKSLPPSAAAEEKTPRSTTPSSVTSSSSVSKSPATPVIRSSRLAAKKKRDSNRKRRISGHRRSDSDSDASSTGSGPELLLPRTRSGSIIKNEDTPIPIQSEVRVYNKKRKITHQHQHHHHHHTAKISKRREAAKADVDDDTVENKKDFPTTTTTKKKRKHHSAEDGSDEEEEEEEEDSNNSGPSTTTNLKGRDFDLNQIRSELKGFSKALKSSSSTNAPIDAANNPTEEEEEEEEEEEDEEEEDNSNSAEKSLTLKGDLSVKELIKDEEVADLIILDEQKPSTSSSDDIYEFKEPEPFEFESRTKLMVDDKNNPSKKRSRIFDNLEEKSSPARNKPSSKDEKSLLDHPPEPRTYSRVPKTNKPTISDEEDLLSMDEEKKIDKSPFDQLIESPSFNLINKPNTEPTATIEEKKVVPEEEEEAEEEEIIHQEISKVETCSNLFKDLPETSDEYSRDMELSDCESQTQIFTRGGGGIEDTTTSLFSTNFPSARNTPDFSSCKTDEGKTTTNSDDDEIQLQIQRVIAQGSSSDDDDDDVENDNIQKIPTESCENSEKIISTTANLFSLPPQPHQNDDDDEIKLEIKEEIIINKQPINPALQETDSSLLESIVAKPPLILNTKQLLIDDTGKELTVKTGTKIADSILQKFSFIKNNIEPSINKSASVESSSSSSVKKNESVVKKIEAELTAVGKTRRRRRAISKAIIDESESDTTDSDHLVIGCDDDDDDNDNVDDDNDDDDEDSQTNSSDNKPLIECKNIDSDLSLQKTITDDSQSQLLTPSVEEHQRRNFNFDVIQQKNDNSTTTTTISELKKVQEKIKKDDDDKDEEPAAAVATTSSHQDPNLHSLLLCEEEIPGSPAPVPEEQPPSNSSDNNIIIIPSTSASSIAAAAAASASVNEIPFASALSNSKITLEPPPNKKPSHLIDASLKVPLERPEEVQTVIENTPPTTPESTISNLSPRGDNDGNISPAHSTAEEPSEFGARAPLKVASYSEEDTQAGDHHHHPHHNLHRKPLEPLFGPPPALEYRKRRRSLRNSEEGAANNVVVPPTAAKRGRKPRQRRDSDSDDASETSTTCGATGGGTNPGSTIISLFERSTRSPRPSKYNFFVEFDPSLDSGQRIAVLQQKLTELRKTYAEVKTELATVERRRKKLRRREREALKAAKQELACA